MALKCSRDRAHGMTKGRGRARGAIPPRGQDRIALLEPEYECWGPINPVPSLSALNAIPSIQELLLRVLARLKKVYLTLIILDAPALTVLVSPSSALVDPLMVHVGPSATPVDPPKIFIISSLPDRSSTRSRLLGLSIAPPRFMVPPISTRPAMSTTE